MYNNRVGFTIILKLLSVVFEPAVALPVNETVVALVTSFGSPDIAPVALSKEKPAPDKFPVVSEYAIVSPSASVAARVAWVPVALSCTVATVPDDVLHTGALSTVINPVADIPDFPVADVNLTL